MYKVLIFAFALSGCSEPVDIRKSVRHECEVLFTSPGRYVESAQFDNGTLIVMTSKTKQTTYEKQTHQIEIYRYVEKDKGFSEIVGCVDLVEQ